MNIFLHTLTMLPFPLETLNHTVDCLRLSTATFNGLFIKLRSCNLLSGEIVLHLKLHLQVIYKKIVLKHRELNQCPNSNSNLPLHGGFFFSNFLTFFFVRYALLVNFNFFCSWANVLVPLFLRVLVSWLLSILKTSFTYTNNLILYAIHQQEKTFRQWLMIWHLAPFISNTESTYRMRSLKCAV